jgi:hypothetical protein
MQRYIRNHKIAAIIMTVAFVTLTFVLSTRVYGLDYQPFSWETFASAYGYDLTSFTAYINEAYVYGDINGSNAPLTLRLMRDGNLVSEVSVETDAYGWFNAYFTAQILVGDVIEVSVPNGDTHVVNVTELEVQVDKAQDLVTGQVEPGRSVDVYVWSYPAGGYSKYVTADSKGVFSADFAGQLDILLGAEADVSYCNTEGYWMKVRDVHARGVSVSVGYDSVWGYGEPGDPVSLTLRDSTGVAKATASETTNSEGYFRLRFRNPKEVDILVGDTVEMQYGTALTQSVTAVKIAVTGIDPATDVITGTAPPNSKIELYVYDSYIGDGVSFLLETDASGVFSANLSSSTSVMGMRTSTALATGDSIPADTVDAAEMSNLDRVEENDRFEGRPSGDPNGSMKSLWDQPMTLPDEQARGAGTTASDTDNEPTAIDATAATFDILPGTYASPTYHDADDNEVSTYSRYAGPFAKAWVNSWNDLFVVGEPGAAVSVTLQNALGAIKSTANFTLSETGGQYASLYDSAGGAVDPGPGDVIDISLSDGSSHKIDVVNVDYIIDRDAETIYGTGPANADLRLVYSYYDGQDTQTDANGYFSHDMNRRLSGGYSFYVHYRPSDAQMLTFYQNVPVFTIYPLDDWISGYGPPQESVVATLKGKSGAVKDIQNTTTDVTNGYYYVKFATDVITGDTVLVGVGPLHYEQEVVTLTIAGDPDNNVVYGMAPPDGWLNVWVSRYFGPYDQYHHDSFSADSNGGYATNLSDLRGGDWMRVMYWAPNSGDQVEVRQYAPALYINQTSDYVSGYTTGSVTGTVTIRDSSNAVKASTVVTAREPYGWFSYYPEVDIVPGDQVEAHVGVINQNEPVITLEGTLDLSADLLSGTGPVNDEVGYSVYHWTGSWYSSYLSGIELEGFADTDGSGAFSADVSSLTDLTPGDYAGLYYLNENDTHYQSYAYTTDPALAVADYPTSVQPNNRFEVAFELSNGAHSQSVYVRWDTVSHADDNAYRYMTDWRQGTIGQNLIGLIAPSGGEVYFKVNAYVDGRTLWSDEYVIDVDESTATTLYDPVSGTTNDDTPTIYGVAAPDASVDLYQDGTQVMNTTADDRGYFDFTFSSSLSPGDYDFHAVATVNSDVGPDSNTVQLAIDPDLPVDPVHILITTRGQTQHLRDSNGLANLGGKVWTRTGDAIEVSVPISATDVYSADLYVGGVFAASMLDSGGDIYVGSYTPPTSGNYHLDLKFRSGGAAGPVETVNILIGLIDPDGYVYDEDLGLDHRVAGATVTCYVLMDVSADTWEVWNASLYGQTNPQTVGADGYYAFFTPSGKYKVKVTAPDYWEYESPVLEVISEPVHHNVPLSPVRQIFLPLTLRN